jgi:hypothetical protein
MNRRTFAAAAVATPLLTGCLWDRYFDVQWNEQVSQPDRKVITVHLKVRFERLFNVFREFTRYGGAIVPRDATLTFDAGGDTGQVVQFFQGLQPVYLGKHDGTWYVVLSGGRGYNEASRKTPVQDWGEWGGSAHLPAKLVGKQFQPISTLELPDEVQKPNLLWLNGTIQEHVAFEGTTITLEQKKDWLAVHSLGPGHNRIEKPMQPSISNKSLSTTGANK